MIFDLNECLCNININVDPYILIEIVLLKHTNFAGNNFNSQSVVLGNKNNLDESNMGNNNIGNDNKINKEVKIASNVLGNNNYSLGNNDNISKNIDSKDSKQKKEKKQVIHKIPFDIKIRINNVFAEAEKQCKIDLINSWQGFMDYLVNVDRSMISLLADVEILVASGKYALVSSKNDVTNTLINESIFKLEELYSVFSGNNYRFAALNQDLWKKEAANYTKNLKNKVKYNYVEENIDNIDVDIAEENINNSGSIEDIASDIFGTFEVE